MSEQRRAKELRRRTRTTKAAAPRVDVPRSVRLRIKEIAGSLHYDGTAAVAWYRLYPARWSFLSLEQREDMIQAQLHAHTALAGRHVHRRVTHRPYAGWAWAKRYSDNTPEPSDPAVWAEHLTRTQRHLRTITLSETEVFLGVDVADRALLSKLAAGIRRGRSTAKENRKIAAALRRVDEAMVTLGEPVGTGDLPWLIHRSVGLGLPEPANPDTLDVPYGMDDLAAFVDGVDLFPQPGQPTIRVVARPSRTGGQPIERYVAVGSIGRMEELAIPERHYPWIAAVQRLPFQVEWSEHYDIVAGPDAQKAIARKLDLVSDQRNQYQAHGVEAPPNLERVAARGRVIRDQMEEGNPLISTRAHGVTRFAVTGRTAEEALGRFEEVRALYRNMLVTVEQDRAQAAIAEEFVPGNRPTIKAHTRRLELRTFVAALPQVTARIGDRQGMYLGYTSGVVKTGAMWDTHFSMEHSEASGLTPILGGLGAGKSALIAKVLWDWMLRRIPATALDPSGGLAGMVHLPEARGHAREMNLMDGSQPPVSPYAVVTVPRRETFDYDDRGDRVDNGEERYRAALAAAKLARKGLAKDVLLGLLPPAIALRGETDVALQHATSAVGGEAIGSLFSVLDALDTLENGNAEHGRMLASFLREMADMPQAARFFPQGHPNDFAKDEDESLVIITMAGTQLPALGSDPARWSPEERCTVPLINLGTHYATRRIYTLPRHVRKGLAIDEGHWLNGWGSGRTLFTRVARDTRKWNLRALVGTQLAGDVLSQNVAGLVNEAFVGLTDDDAAAKEALRILRVAQGVGYERNLARLSPPDAQGKRPPYRDFVFRDTAGNVEQVRIDMGNIPHVLAAIDTTARQRPAVPRDHITMAKPVGVPA